MTDPNLLTKRQAEILQFIRNFIDLAHYPPTYREICEMAGLSSTSNAHYHMTKLREAGYVTWTERRARTIKLVKRD